LSDLLFGVATADHQCEAYERRWDDVRDRWERDLGLTRRGEATDFWTRYVEDVALARDLGCNAFRFSIAWARVEPEPGVFDPGVLHHYREMAARIVAAGMEPVVTLMHYTWPLHVQDGTGGLIGDAFPDRFAAYAREVARALAPDVRWWLTFNEPNQLVYGYLKPWWQGEYRMPPGLPAGAGVEEQLRCTGLAMRNLFLANARGRAEIRAVRPDAMVGTNPFVVGLPDWLQRFLDWRATRLRSRRGWAASGRLRARRPRARFLDPLLRSADLLLCALDSNWWFLGMQGRLPDWLCPPGCAGQQDYVGLDYYWGIPNVALHRLRQLNDAIAGDFAHAPVWPAAMRRVLHQAARMFPGLPVMVVENGCVTEASGVPRAEYLEKHLREALRARDEGVPLAGYLCWSITSNREWGLPFGPGSDFGLYHIELDADPELRRVATPAAEVYRELIAEARGVRTGNAPELARRS
jgi:beta-glucosidase/6-phospho-beta-glucosidase/beta-galactosidase